MYADPDDYPPPGDDPELLTEVRIIGWSAVIVAGLAFGGVLALIWPWA